MNGHERPVNAMNGMNDPSTVLARKVFDAEFVNDDSEPAIGPHRTLCGTWSRLARFVGALVRRVWRAGVIVRLRSVAAYRVRKLPQDVLRLVWFVARGNWRWLVKTWSWATYADLRADARNARLAGDSETRRKAQELIRADAMARWARVGIVLRRALIACRVTAPVAVMLWAIDSWMDRSAMWAWLAGVYAALGALWTVATAAIPVVVGAAPVVWLVAAAFEGRDKSPGAGWLIQPDRDDADSWIDERMISRALAHLGVAPLNRFFKDGGELAYPVPARKDGDGTFAQVRLPLGVTADMVASQRAKLAANLGRAGLETWPTKGEEDGILDLWVADKGTLNGGAGPWPLLEDGDRVDVFEGVPFGLSQRGVIINAPLIGANWLIGGRPGQGKSSALRTLMLGAALDPTAELWAFVLGESPDFEPFEPRLARYGMGMDDTVAEAVTQALADLVSDMERRGKVLGEQPGHPPKVSRRLADKRDLGLHPLVCVIDECHELFQHPKYGKRAAELAVRLIKRGRKYGIIVLLATQSPTKDSLPREVTRNVACGVAFSVADQVANDGLLGSGRYAAGVRATELRMHTDRGTCVAVGLTSATFELVRTFYVPFEDGVDNVSPIIARAMRLLAQTGRSIAQEDRLELDSAPVDHLADIAEVMRGERRVRTQIVLMRLADLNPTEYEGWTFSTLRVVLGEHGIAPRKSDGVKVVRADDVDTALTVRDRDDVREKSLTPSRSLTASPSSDVRKSVQGTRSPSGARDRETRQSTVDRRRGHGPSEEPDAEPGVDNGSGIEL